MSFDGRIGTAFHRVLQSLPGIASSSISLDEAIEGARAVFSQEVKAQERQADEQPREQSLPRNRTRIDLAMVAVLAEVRSAFHEAQEEPTESLVEVDVEESGVRSRSHESTTGRELSVSSRDGLLRGRIDKVQRMGEDVRIIDYKSALRQDLPERYERQVQLYALMWWESDGQWPAEAEVHYPLLGTRRTVPINGEDCRKVGEEARQVITLMERTTIPKNLASPGDVCKVCEFRPWCQPFWDWQASETNATKALERSYLGMEGIVHHIEVVDQHYKVQIAWNHIVVTLFAPVERFPHLSRVTKGTKVRCLEFRLQGQRRQPRSIPSEWSEIFAVE